MVLMKSKHKDTYEIVQLGKWFYVFKRTAWQTEQVYKHYDLNKAQAFLDRMNKGNT
jgi:hypothetical protein